MTGEKRPILSLPKGKGASTELADDEKRVHVGLFDVLLPSRQFIVHHKVAEVGQVSLTTEFLLRLLYSVDGLEEEDVAHFFGFNANEMAFVVNEAEARAYVARQDGRIWLTDAGYALFNNGEKPQIYEVQKCTEKIGFDLVSMAPCERENLSEFELTLPELGIRDEQKAATASHAVKNDAFRKHYREIVGRKDRDPAAGVRKALYSIDDVIPSDRFLSVVPVLAIASIRKPGEPEPVLEHWRSGYELEDRSAVVNAVAVFLDNLKTVRHTEDDQAYQIIADLAPDYLKEYMTRTGLSVMRFFKKTAGSAGELRSNRQTVGIVGPLFSPENSERIFDAMRYAICKEPEEALGSFLWLVPTASTWGTSRALKTFLDRIWSGSHGSPIGKDKTIRGDIAVTCGGPQKHVRKLFHRVLMRADNGSIPSALEMLLFPGRMVAVTVHSVIGPGRGFPVPLGVLSFDQEVVKRAHEFLHTQLPRYVEMHGSKEQFDVHSITQWHEALGHGEPGDAP
jgi:hypothetical protein